MSVTQGLSEFKIEAVENAICLDDINFNRVSVEVSVPISTGITVEGKYYPIHAEGKATSYLDVYSYDGYIKMNIPKLMPFYSVQRPYSHLYNVDRSIIINSSTNNPGCSASVKVCNYIEVKSPTNYIKKTGVKYGEKLQCIFPNNNITEPSLLCLQ